MHLIFVYFIKHPITFMYFLQIILENLDNCQEWKFYLSNVAERL